MCQKIDPKKEPQFEKSIVLKVEMKEYPIDLRTMLLLFNFPSRWKGEREIPQGEKTGLLHQIHTQVVRVPTLNT